MTTREDHLLKKLGFDHLDRLESLADDDALSLLAVHALGVYNFDSNPTLRQRGEDIVKKCGCLPLAIKAVGRLLSSKTNGEDWDEVLSSEIWDLENSYEIVPALRLSYHYLSANLKQLFAYCSLFPKDFLFDRENLVLLWMAEGYLNQSIANKSPEQLGHEYFEKLLSRSFFQRAPNNESLFVMHDLMNDLATFVSRDYFLRFDKKMEEVGGSLAKYRHMSFIREEYVGYQKFEAFKRAKILRTFLAVYVGVDQSWNRFFLSNKILVDVLPELLLLRVLCLSRFEITEVPEFIGSLKHLRYLNLSQTKIKALPEHVGNLYNLETLIIFGCESLTKLPKSFSKLKKLRHLDMRDTSLLKKLPLGIGELRSLHTLTKIIVGGDGDFAISELKGLKNLHGGISIEGLNKVQSPMNAREAGLNLKRLTNLELKWDDGYEVGTLKKEVLNELKPDSERLKVLSIVSYGGIEFSNWVGDPSFQQLVHVSIRGCKNCTSLPPLEKLPSLKKLVIQGMDKVRSIGLELADGTSIAFPSLEILKFKDMRGWVVWSTHSNSLNVEFPCLRNLHIKNCPSLIDVSLKEMPSLRFLEIKECGDGLLRNLVEAASLVVELDIRSISRLTDEKWRGVMEYLGAVEKLSIWGCNEIRYLWESEALASKVLMNLKQVLVYKCNNLVSLGEKEDEKDFGSNILSSLKVLRMGNCNSMVRCWCPNSNNIETLDIRDCNLVTSVYFPTTTGGGLKIKELHLRGCEKLMENISNPSMPMLEVIFIEAWTNLKSIIQLSNFIHLTSLFITNCPGIKSFPDVELSNLHLLKSLCIIKCPNMNDSFPRGLWPPKLRSLSIGGLRKPISEWGHQNFPTSLGSLGLHGEPDVSNFSQLSHLLPSSLTLLWIWEFDKLESLSTGLQHLTSLQHLNVLKCPKMNYLPETLLPSLLSLYIVDCPNLKEKCNGRGSHYWPLISHIPCINI